MVGRRAVVLVLAVAIAGMAPRAALAATDTSDHVVGVEIAATSTVGRFVGEANGRLPGVWYATVDHRPLSGSRPATITGGQLKIVTLLGGLPATLSGFFTGGAVTQTSGFGGCINQTLTVIGSLATVGVQGRGHPIGTGRFSATLTHYQARILGRCIAYSASVAGTVSLNLPSLDYASSVRAGGANR